VNAEERGQPNCVYAYVHIYMRNPRAYSLWTPLKEAQQFCVNAEETRAAQLCIYMYTYTYIRIRLKTLQSVDSIKGGERKRRERKRGKGSSIVCMRMYTYTYTRIQL